MEMLVYIGLYVCFTLIVLGVLTVLGFGIRGLQDGKVSLLSAATVGAPFVLALLLSLIFGDLVKGAIIACIVIFGLALVAVMVNSIRGFIT